MLFNCGMLGVFSFNFLFSYVLQSPDCTRPGLFFPFVGLYTF